MRATRELFWLALFGLSTILPLSAKGVYGPPRLRLTGHDLRQVASVGSDVILPCPVKADISTLFLEWLKGREPLTGVGKYRITSSGALRIRKVTQSDSGDYTCKAINGFGSVKIQVFLMVIDQRQIFNNDINNVSNSDIFGEISESGGPPHFTFVTSFNGSVIQRSAGGTVRLKCEGTGKPGPKIHWLKNGIRLKHFPPSLADSAARHNETSDPGRIVRKRWSIQVEKLRRGDSGNYTCVLRNPYGFVSTSFLLEVIDGTKPEVTGYHPLNTTVEYGSAATFQCRVRSEVAPHIRWLKRIDSNSMSRFKTNSRTVKGQQRIIRVQGEYFRFLKSSQVVARTDGSFMNKLLIREARESDSGKYICLGANSLGYSYRSAFLSVMHRHHSGILNWERTVILRPGQPDAVMIGIPITVGILVGVVVALSIVCHSRRSQTQIQQNSGLDKTIGNDSTNGLKSVEQQTSFSSFPPPNLHPIFSGTTTSESESRDGIMYPSSICESTTVSSYKPHFFQSEILFQEKSVVAKLHKCSPKDQFECFFLRDNV